MKIETSGSKKRFQPANRCIYCNRRGVPLYDEHIIPFGLGGNWILPKASCKQCEKVINSFEHPLLRGYLYPARVHLGFPSRHGDPRPESFRMKFTDDGTIKNVPLADHPCFLVLPKCIDEPKILTNASPNGKIEVGMWAYAFQVDHHRRVIKVTDGRTVTSAVPLDFGQFVRFLAKIGHAFAAASPEAGDYRPLTSDLILGNMTNMDLLVGGLRDTINPKDDLHDIWLASYMTKHGHYLIANVQLFANLQGAIYRVVVGEYPDLKGPGLGRRYQEGP